MRWYSQIVRTLTTTLVLLLIASAIGLGAVWLWQSVPEDRPEKPAVARNPDRAAARPAPALAELPWLRDELDPPPARVPLASCAWSARRPGRAAAPVEPAAAAWVRDVTQQPPRVSVPLATLPWPTK